MTDYKKALPPVPIIASGKNDLTPLQICLAAAQGIDLDSLQNPRPFGTYTSATTFTAKNKNG